MKNTGRKKKNVSLTQLANHLLKGELLHRKFDFSIFNGYDEDENAKIKHCGTNGCALGEMPILDGRWGFSKNLNLTFNGRGNDFSTWGFAKKYWGLTFAEVDHLFAPCSQYPELYGGKHLTETSSRKSVAKNILEFVKKTKKNRCVLPDPRHEDVSGSRKSK